MLAKIPEAYRKPVYALVVVVGIVSMVLSVLVVAGVITETQVGEVFRLWLLFGSGLMGVFSGLMALKNIKHD